MYPGMGISLPNICFLHSLPSLMSDHTPLLLQGDIEHYQNSTFRFENFWVNMDGFKEMVQQVWSKPVHSTLPLKRLNTKLARLAKGIRRWGREKVGDTRLQLAIVKEVLSQLVAAQENRLLTNQEKRTAPTLKSKEHRTCSHRKIQDPAAVEIGIHPQRGCEHKIFPHQGQHKIKEKLHPLPTHGWGRGSCAQ